MLHGWNTNKKRLYCCRNNMYSRLKSIWICFFVFNRSLLITSTNTILSFNIVSFHICNVLNNIYDHTHRCALQQHGWVIVQHSQCNYYDTLHSKIIDVEVNSHSVLIALVQILLQYSLTYITAQSTKENVGSKCFCKPLMRLYLCVTKCVASYSDDVYDPTVIWGGGGAGGGVAGERAERPVTAVKDFFNICQCETAGYF